MSLTIAEATEKLRGVGVTIPTPWLQGPIVDRSGVEKMEREHAERMAKLKADADTRIEKGRQHKRDLVAQSRRHRELLREESIERRKQEDRVELTERRDRREFLQAIGGHLSKQDEQQLADEIEEANTNPNDPDVVRCRAWLERTWLAGGIDVRICVDPLIRNGAASRQGGYVEIPPIQSLITAIIVAHELGHLLHPTIEHERIVDGEFGKKVSFGSELAAWRWVLERIPVWTAEMHAFMVRCLDSYRRYATEAEAKEADALCSQLNFFTVRLRIVAA